MKKVKLKKIKREGNDSSRKSKSRWTKAERIRRYGIKSYIKSALKKEPTEKLINRYKKEFTRTKKVYGEKEPKIIYEPMVEQPTHLQHEFWVLMEKDGKEKELNVWTKYHKATDRKHYLNEAVGKAKQIINESGWTEIDHKELRTKYFIWERKIYDDEEKDI